MQERNSYLSSANVKEQGRTAYYKMLESVRQGELIQVRRGVYANIDQLSGNMIDINTIVPGQPGAYISSQPQCHRLFILLLNETGK